MNTIEIASSTVMSATARAAEITSILAAAIVRTQFAENQAQSAKQREINLGFLPGKSVHTTHYQQERL